MLPDTLVVLLQADLSNIEIYPLYTMKAAAFPVPDAEFAVIADGVQDMASERPTMYETWFVHAHNQITVIVRDPFADLEQQKQKVELFIKEHVRNVQAIRRQGFDTPDDHLDWIAERELHADIQ